MNDGHRTSTIPRPKAREELTPVRGRGKTAKKSAKPTGDDAGKPIKESSRGDRTGSILMDFTTPIERTKQLVPQRRGRLVVALFSVIIALAIGAALFVLPIKSWFQQRDDLTVRTGELDTLTDANDQLQLEVERLQTDAGIREAARGEIDYVEKGEQRFTIVSASGAPITLPTGWPYNLVAQIVALRGQQATAAAAAAVAANTPETAPETTPAITP
ncbi:MAG: septum formation initiator family protein [Ilumatobacteraceae bacterium]